MRQSKREARGWPDSTGQGSGRGFRRREKGWPDSAEQGSGWGFRLFPLLRGAFALGLEAAGRLGGGGMFRLPWERPLLGRREGAGRARGEARDDAGGEEVRLPRAQEEQAGRVPTATGQRARGRRGRKDAAKTRARKAGVAFRGSGAAAKQQDRGGNPPGQDRCGHLQAVTSNWRRSLHTKP